MRTHACLRRLGVIGAGLLLVVGFIVSGQTVIPRAHAATVLTVNTNADIPCGGSTFSLRCAIEQANADVSGDTITFNIPSSTCCLIQLRTHLPTLTAVNTVIDGYSQPGSAKNVDALNKDDSASPLVQIDGSDVPGADGLDIAGSNDTVDGLTITHFNPSQAGGPGGGAGIRIVGQAGAAIIPNNGDLIWGNFIGVYPDGKTPGPNNIGLIVGITAFKTTIGGTTAASRNVISGNHTYGIELTRSYGNTVQGNYIGTDRTGTNPIPNLDGLAIFSDTALDASNNPAPDQIGGPGAGNLISGNRTYGILGSILNGQQEGPIGGVVQGNYVGVDAGDNAPLPNGAGGVVLNSSIEYLVGGTAAGDGNVVSGNGADGVVLLGGAGSLNKLEGNYIGVTSGGRAMPNAADGVFAGNYTSADSIGVVGSSSGQNYIADNAGWGVNLGSSSIDPVHVSINRNIFAANKLGGIGLNGLVPALCTYGPSYTRGYNPNDFTPCPLVLVATTQRITGEAQTGDTVELYSAPSASDDEGLTWLGTVQAGTCGSPPCTNFSRWNLLKSQYAHTLSRGQHIVATATDIESGYPAQTSPFSRDVPVGQQLIVNNTSNSNATCTTSACSLRAAITMANSDGQGDEIDFKIPAAQCSNMTIQTKSVPVCAIKPTTALPSLTAPSTYIDGYSQPKSVQNANVLASGDNAILTIWLYGQLTAGGNGLSIGAPYDSAEGLSITRFSGNGVYIGKGGYFDIVDGSFIGLSPDGATAVANGNGVQINGGATFGTAGGRAIVDPNVLSGNVNYGFEDSGGGSNIVRENLIGTDAAGTAPVANGYDGVLMYGTLLDTIGGYRTGEGNVISGNFNDGVDGLDTNYSAILGNEIGVDAASDANVNVGNGFAGIYLYLGSNNNVGGLPFGFGGNVIAGNGADGVDVLSESGDGIYGNYVGYVSPNTGNGIVFGNSSFETGFAARQSPKLMSLHVAAERRASLSGPVVGGETPMYDSALTNSIWLNGARGILVGQSTSDSDVHVLMRFNSMASNGQGGICFYSGGSSCFGFGPNDDLGIPSISTADTSVISGFSSPFALVDLYLAASIGASDQGYGEGWSYLGTAAADSNGNWSFNPGSEVSAGNDVTATSSLAVPDGSGYFETSGFAYDAQVASNTAGPRRKQSPLCFSCHHSGVHWKRFAKRVFGHVPQPHYHSRLR